MNIRHWSDIAVGKGIIYHDFRVLDFEVQINTKI
jgi:hypothetical protein